MVKLYFIRHGQSQNNVIMEAVDREDYLFSRVQDPPLTEKGHQQAELVADFLARPYRKNGVDPQNREGFGLTHLYCSLMTRSIQTALPIAHKTGLTLEAWPEVHETGGVFSAEKRDGETVLFGLPGKGRSYFESQFPELVIPEDLPEEGWWNRDKEPRENYQTRAQSVVDRLLSEHGDQDHRVGIVMHGGIFARILSVFFDIQVARYWFQMNNCGISRVEFDDSGRVLLTYMNKVDFLPDDLIT